MNNTETPAAANLQTIKSNGVTWVDIDNPTAVMLAQLEKDFHLHPVHLAESVQKVQHTQVEHEEQYLFFVLHVPVTTRPADKILVNQIGVFLGKDFLITIRSGTAPAVTDLFARCQQPDKQEEYFKEGAGQLLYRLISELLDDISIITDGVVGELDTIEDLVFDNDASDAQRIGKVRQKIVRLRRVIGPKRQVLENLTDQIDAFTGQSLSRYYSNNTKTVNRLWEVIEEAKETVEIYKDADFTTSTEQTNQILAVLTIIFTLTIPITVVGTLYGMNIPLPGGNQVGAWIFWGKYTTLGILIGLSSLVALSMYFHFRRKKWF
jgi:magnesium transporter